MLCQKSASEASGWCKECVAKSFAASSSDGTDKRRATDRITGTKVAVIDAGSLHTFWCRAFLGQYTTLRWQLALKVCVTRLKSKNPSELQWLRVRPCELSLLSVRIVIQMQVSSVPFISIHFTNGTRALERRVMQKVYIMFPIMGQSRPLSVPA